MSVSKVKTNESEINIAEAIEQTEKRGAYMRSKHMREITAKAFDMAKADRSDPFTYARVVSHYQNGIAGSLDDYSVTFTQEKRVTANGSEFFVEIPQNMKRM